QRSDVGEVIRFFRGLVLEAQDVAGRLGAIGHVEIPACEHHAPELRELHVACLAERALRAEREAPRLGRVVGEYVVDAAGALAPVKCDEQHGAAPPPRFLPTYRGRSARVKVCAPGRAMMSQLGVCPRRSLEPGTGSAPQT